MKGKLGNYSPDRGETCSATGLLILRESFGITIPELLKYGEFRHKKNAPPKRGANIRKVNLL